MDLVWTGPARPSGSLRPECRPSIRCPLFALPRPNHPPSSRSSSGSDYIQALVTPARCPLALAWPCSPTTTSPSEGPSSARHALSYSATHDGSWPCCLSICASCRRRVSLIVRSPPGCACLGSSDGLASLAPCRKARNGAPASNVPDPSSSSKPFPRYSPGKKKQAIVLPIVRPRRLSSNCDITHCLDDKLGGAGVRCLGMNKAGKKQ